MPVACVALVAALSGCAPYLATFAQPQAPGGEITDGSCPPQPDFLLFKRDGVVIAVHTRAAEPGRQAIHLSFEVPANRSVRLLGSTLEATTARGEVARSPIAGVWYGSRNQSAEVHPDSLLSGSTHRLGRGTNTGYKLTHHAFFTFTAEYATALGDTFVVTLPRLLVNDVPWEPPPVRFVRVRMWLVSALNC